LWGDVAALKRLARWCRRYGPFVGLEETEAPESLLIDVTGSAHLFHGEESLGRCVLRELAHVGLTAYVAIADTIGAAWAAAFCAARRHSPSPIVIPPGGQTAALESWPVEALRLAPSVVETLRELDLRTIGQLWQLPRETLPSRFGPEILLRLDQALGRVPEMIVPERPEEPVEARWGCEEPIDNAVAIEAILNRLLNRVVRRVAARGAGILRIEISLTCPAQEPLRISIGCVRSTLHQKRLLELVCLQLERLRMTRGVVDFLVRVTATAPLDVSQPDLFGGEKRPDDQRELEALLNRLSSRLGRSSVLSPELRADHQPERATAFRPVIGSSKPEPRDGEVPTPGSRPVQLLSLAVPVAVTSIVPDGPPIRLRWQNADHRIIRYDGPERIETGWWRQSLIRRDYYRVETDDGQRYWLFRALDDGHWFLHGEF
jgi:protein ImuB